MMKTKRRNRWYITPLEGEEPPVIDEKNNGLDTAIFRLLARYACLDTGQIYDFLPPELQGYYQSFQDRLTKLAAWKYIVRSRNQRRDLCKNIIYELGSGGRKVLKELAINEPFSDPVTRAKLGAGQHLPHANRCRRLGSSGRPCRQFFPDLSISPS